VIATIIFVSYAVLRYVSRAENWRYNFEY
jgi:hypothetical protein